MNTIILLGATVAAGIASGLLRAVLGSYIARDANRGEDADPEPVDELATADWDGEGEPLLAWIKELPAVRSEDGTPGATAKHRREVPAR